MLAVQRALETGHTVKAIGASHSFTGIGATDGVRLNIRPFMTAGVLRENTPPKLNVKWEKDRGKDVASAPWHHVFKGERINDWHLTLAEKKAAREVSHAQ